MWHACVCGKDARPLQGGVQQCGSTNTELWLRYCMYLQQQGKGTGQVHWRAVLSLQNARLPCSLGI